MKEYVQHERQFSTTDESAVALLQDIWNKTRLNKNNDNNNRIEVNHIYRQVEFKKGFMVGNPIDYSLAVSDKYTNAITYLQKYFKDQYKASKDIEKYEDLYVCGISEQFIIPKTYGFNEEGEAPFELYNSFVKFSMLSDPVFIRIPIAFILSEVKVL